MATMQLFQVLLQEIERELDRRCVFKLSAHRFIQRCVECSLTHHFSAFHSEEQAADACEMEQLLNEIQYDRSRAIAAAATSGATQKRVTFGGSPTAVHVPAPTIKQRPAHMPAPSVKLAKRVAPVPTPQPEVISQMCTVASG